MKTLDESRYTVSTSDNSELDGPSQGTGSDRQPPAHPQRRRLWWPVAIGAGLLALLAVALSTLGGSGGNPDLPPTISYGEDTCARCGMIIDDPRYSAAYRTADGEVRLFDGIDEMVLGYRERHERASAFYVHDYGSGDWLRAEGAFFVVGARPGPSMGSSVVAARTESEAQSLADRLGGEVATFATLLEGSAISSEGGHPVH